MVSDSPKDLQEKVTFLGYTGPTLTFQATSLRLSVATGQAGALCVSLKGLYVVP